MPSEQDASMGPLVYTSGNWLPGRLTIRIRALQWGRWFTPAETSPMVVRRRRSGCPLQWGRWFTPAETGSQT